MKRGEKREDEKKEKLCSLGEKKDESEWCSLFVGSNGKTEEKKKRLKNERRAK